MLLCLLASKLTSLQGKALPRVKSPAPLASAPEPKILAIRGQRVILDEELARLYGVSTSAFNQAIKRNENRFPADFMFQLTAEEATLLKSQSVTSKLGRSPQAPLRIHRAWGRAGCQCAAVKSRYHHECAHCEGVHPHARGSRWPSRARSPAAGARAYPLLALDLKTDARFEEVFVAIRSLMQSPRPKRPIGFVWPDERPQKK